MSGILYAVIANYASYDTLIAARPPNKELSTLFATKILAKLSEHEQRERKTYSHKMFDIHLVTDEDIVVICVATNNASQKLVFAFLEDAEKEYKNNLIERGEQGARNAAAGVLDEKLNHYKDTSIPRVERLTHSKEELKDVTVLDISEIIGRDEEVNVLLDFVRQNSTGCTIL